MISMLTLMIHPLLFYLSEIIVQLCPSKLLNAFVMTLNIVFVKKNMHTK